MTLQRMCGSNGDQNYPTHFVRMAFVLRAKQVRSTSLGQKEIEDMWFFLTGPLFGSD